MSVAADDRFAQPDLAELTIELATSGSRRLPASDERSVTVAITRAPAADPRNDWTRNRVPSWVPELLVARSAIRLRTEFVCGRAGNVREDVQREHAPESVHDRCCSVGRLVVEFDDRAR